jgi:hypothetical protein
MLGFYEVDQKIPGLERASMAAVVVAPKSSMANDSVMDPN